LERKEKAMTKLVALALGFAAWSGVVALSLLITFNMGDRNQVLMFLPILVAVVAAWAVGQVVTERVLEKKEGM
jgi:uncharacterized membrane protein